MELSLHDKVAIITGAGRGIGDAIAQTLASVGAKVAVNDINPDRAERVASSIREKGGQAIGIMADISNKFQSAHLIETTRTEWGQLDILVNNAGVQPVVSVLKMDEWDWDRCLDVNLKGTFLMSQLCGRVMADENQTRGGVIINISSVAGVEIPFEHRSAYCASQAGIVGFTRECAREFAGYGIRVNTILLGAIDMPMTQSPKNDVHNLAKWQQDIPLTRLRFSQGVADAVLFLCSSNRNYMTGSTVILDGGLVMP